MILALQRLQNLIASVVAQTYELIPFCGIRRSTSVIGVLYIVLGEEETELLLKEFLGSLVGSTGNGLLNTLLYLENMYLIIEDHSGY